MRTKHYLPAIMKSDLGDAAIREILKREDLTIKQLRRVFSYTYGRLNSPGAKAIYESQKKIIQPYEFKAERR